MCRWLLFAPLLLAGCGPRPVEDWLAQLKDPEVVKRREAIRELGAAPRDAERVVPALAEALRDDNGYVRHDAALALGKFGPAARPAVPALRAALGDREASVRSAAGTALKKIDPEAARGAGVR